MTLVRVASLTKEFRPGWRRPPVRALDGVTAEVVAGEVVALTGGNGAGKSTLLRILATTVVADAGTAQVCGWDVAAQPARVRACIGLARGDASSLYGRLTLRANLAFFAALRGLSGRAAAERVADALRRVDLEAVADRQASALSSGMSCRAVLARALLGEPRVLLVDEVERSLDQAGRGLAAEAARDAAARGGAVLWVTHDRDVVQVADRELRMEMGRISA